MGKGSNTPRQPSVKFVKKLPNLNQEKQAGKIQGEQQFIAKGQLQDYVEKIVFDKKTGTFVTKKVLVPVDFIYDPTRKRAIMSPVALKPRN